MKTPRTNRRPTSYDATMIPNYDIAILGDVGVGKSSMIERLLNGRYLTDHIPTAAEVYGTTIFDDNEKKLATLQIFDTAGGFEFPAILRITITKCQAFIVVYSVNSIKSLEVAKRQLDEITSIKGKYFPCLLVGNKSDISHETREVSYDQGVQTAVQHGCSFLEVSVKDNINVHQTFSTITKTIEYTAAIKEKLCDYNKIQQRHSRRRSGNMKFLFKHSSKETSSLLHTH